MGHIIHFNWFYCDALIAFIFQRWMTEKFQNFFVFSIKCKNWKIKTNKFLVFGRKKSHKAATTNGGNILRNLLNEFRLVWFPWKLYEFYYSYVAARTCTLIRLIYFDPNLFCCNFVLAHTKKEKKHEKSLQITRKIVCVFYFRC